MSHKTLLLSVLLLTTLSHALAATDNIICFHASWAGYRTGDGSFKPENIDPNLCTHVLYAFLGVNPDGTLKLLDPWNEINLEGLAKVAALKQTNPNLKVLLSIGGWNAGHDLLAGIVGSPALRTSLINSAIQNFKTYNYDGLDIDWEYPQAGDKDNFASLLREMKTAFAAQGYLLSVTTSSTPLDSYDVAAISESADLINLMTYDFHTAYDGYTGHNSPFPLVSGAVSDWLAAGVDRAKLSISVPFYGHDYSLSDPNNHVPGAPATAGIAGPFTQSPGILGYNEICAYHSDWTREWDSEAQVPYRYSGSNWVSYDDEESIALKASWAKSQGLAGVAVWSLDTDDFHGRCGTDHVLLRAIKNSMSP